MSQKLKHSVDFIKAQPFLFIRFLRTNKPEMINISHEWWPPDKNSDIKINIMLYRPLPLTVLLIRFVLLHVLLSSFLRIHLPHHFFSNFIHSQYFSYASIYFGSRWIFVFFLLLILELFSLTFLLYFMHSYCTHGHRKNKKLIKVWKKKKKPRRVLLQAIWNIHSSLFGKIKHQQFLIPISISSQFLLVFRGKQKQVTPYVEDKSVRPAICDLVSANKSIAQVSWNAV